MRWRWYAVLGWAVAFGGGFLVPQSLLSWSNATHGPFDDRLPIIKLAMLSTILCNVIGFMWIGWVWPMLLTRERCTEFHHPPAEVVRRMRPMPWVPFCLVATGAGVFAITYVRLGWHDSDWNPWPHGVAAAGCTALSAACVLIALRINHYVCHRVKQAAKTLDVCYACGYDLRGHPEAPCPECGYDAAT